MNEMLVIFDLDGVLIDSKLIHFNSLNKALGDKKISYEEHLSTYDGLSTNEKLEMLTEKKKLLKTEHKKIWEEKQKYTLEEFSNLKPDLELIGFFKEIKKRNIKISVASNSIRETVKIILLKLGLLEYVDYFVSNEDVMNSKPHPEMYWKCMTAFKTIPENTVIVEDSHVGIKGANDSKSNVVMIKSRKHFTEETLEKILSYFINKNKTSAWKSDTLNVLIPMAGAGSRFKEQGYTFPKPLIEVLGKPMIQLVVENLNVNCNFIFIVQKTHYEKYNLNYLLPLLVPKCTIIQVDGITDGAACTTLLAEKYIDNNDSLLIANSDQYVVWDSSKTLYSFCNDEIDAGIITFPSTHPKWSYAKLDDNNFVCEVAEKKPISKHATAGIYFWQKGSDYVKYAKKMIENNVRVNGEFYVCPVFNEAIKDNKKIKIMELGENCMWGLGTPEDLDYFLKYYKKETL